MGLIALFIHRKPTQAVLHGSVQTDDVIDCQRENRFTHDIAYPRARFYQTEESENGDPVMIELSDRYLASEIDSFMDVNTLTTKAFYVQDQY